MRAKKDIVRCEAIHRPNKGSNRRKVVASRIDTSDFGLQPTNARVAVDKLKCALCYTPLERITAIFGNLFQTLVSLTVIDNEGWPVAKEVPKYVKAHLCLGCFKEHDNQPISDISSYLMFNALVEKSNPNPEAKLGKGKGIRETLTEPIPVTHDPYKPTNPKLTEGERVVESYINFKADRVVDAIKPLRNESKQAIKFRQMVEELSK